MSLINGRMSEVAPSIKLFSKVEGFLAKTRKIDKPFLQRSGNILKCSSSLSPGDVLTYVKYMAENEFIRD